MIELLGLMWYNIKKSYNLQETLNMGDNMKKQEKLKEEIKELIDKGAELGAYLNFDEQTKSCPQLANFIGQYEI